MGRVEDQLREEDLVGTLVDLCVIRVLALERLPASRQLHTHQEATHLDCSLSIGLSQLPVAGVVLLLEL